MLVVISAGCDLHTRWNAILARESILGQGLVARHGLHSRHRTGSYMSDLQELFKVLPRVNIQIFLILPHEVLLEKGLIQGLHRHSAFSFRAQTTPFAASIPNAILVRCKH